MKVRKVLICDPISESALNKLREKGIEVIDASNEPKDKLKELVKGVDVMVVRSATKVRKELIDEMDQMKLIIRGGVGLDNIDVEYAESKGIKVLNTPRASTISVAELTFAHILALARDVTRSTIAIKEGKWEKKKLKGMELYGKTLGLIGIGRIGQEVAKRAIAFGMYVIAYRRSRKPVRGVELVDLDTLLRNSDIISIHCPLTDETRHLLGEEEFKKMKDGVIIVNCARGGIIDEKALIKYVKSGKVRGVGLDVFEEEPPTNKELLSLPNVSFTPHIGAQTKEAQERVGEEVVETILGFF